MRVRLLWIGAAACFCATKPADANLIVFEFTGQVTAFENDNGLWNGHPFADASVGDNFALQYGFESTTADTNADGQLGWYPALVSMRVTVGSAQFEYGSFSSNRIEVGNDWFSLDTYLVVARGTDSGDNSLDTRINLVDVHGTMFSSDTLPTSLVHSDFGQRFALLLPGSGVVAGPLGDALQASIDGFSVVAGPGAVPAPGAVVLALIGLPMVAWIRRRVS